MAFLGRRSGEEDRQFDFAEHTPFRRFGESRRWQLAALAVRVAGIVVVVERVR